MASAFGTLRSFSSQKNSKKECVSLLSYLLYATLCVFSYCQNHFIVSEVEIYQHKVLIKDEFSHYNFDSLLRQRLPRAVLECVPTDGDVKYWFLHGKGKSIGVDETPQNGVFMNPNGTLQFQNVSKKDHEGEHICVVSFNEEVEAFSVRMDVKPLTPSNLWEVKYRGMFVTGFLAAFVCLILFAAEDNSKMEKAFVNQGMTNDEEEYNIRM
ncbi:hypothetical protein Anas_01776 [Armadillidium nasatum]|uniref:Ig-like domain-containing protein n=1 Tax=Armadillidium nasatum TaxID=96803 RepID=A0A5N5TPF1_9CRUS|nr:hypothetical protein Anas_01776 [Armadillidium nasatum]